MVGVGGCCKIKTEGGARLGLKGGGARGPGGGTSVGQQRTTKTGLRVMKKADRPTHTLQNKKSTIVLLAKMEHCRLFLSFERSKGVRCQNVIGGEATSRSRWKWTPMWHLPPTPVQCALCHCLRCKWFSPLQLALSQVPLAGRGHQPHTFPTQ